MNRFRWLTSLFLVLGFVSSVSAADAIRPNIVFILADDLGFGELGCFGQTKIKTPNLDKLAAEGMRLTQHYSGNAVCAPSRCVLMTGKHPGHAFIRNNRSTPPEGQYPIPADTVTLPKLLGKQGYVCGGFGKWGLGGPGSAGEPLKQGMNRFFGFNCQGVAHNHYPTHLWDDDKQVSLNNPMFDAHQNKLAAGAGPNDPASYAGFVGKEFAQDVIMEQALRFVRDNKSRPFFLYVPSTIPHLAIQVPEDSLAEYSGKFDDPPYVGGKGYLPHRQPRAAYAAMITRLDRDVGRIVALVRELGLEENTLFVFSSDNGPAYGGIGGTDADFFNSAGPLRGKKGSLYEGGFRVPTIARWKGKIPAGTPRDRVSGFEDWLPTLLDVAGAKDSTPKEIDGLSLLPTLRGESQSERPFLYREFPDYSGQQSVRVGDWKAIRQNLKPKGKPPATDATKIIVKTELYNLKDDLAESKDVAAEHPDVLAKLEKLMREQHVPSAEFPFAVLDRAK